MSQLQELKLPDQSSPSEGVNYSSLTKTEIQSQLDKQGISYKTSATKSELISLLAGDVNG